MSRLLNRLGGGAARHPERAIGLWLAGGAVVLGLAGAFGGALNDNYTIPGTGSQRSYDLLKVPVTDFKGDEGVVALEDATRSLRTAGYQTEYGGQVPELPAPRPVAEPVGAA